MNKNPRNAKRTTESLAFLVAAAACVSGCSLKVDPYTDELSQRPPITSPSWQAARAAATDHTTVQRSSAPVLVRAADGSVTHSPLYFEDKAETTGSDDGQFAWTGEEYLYILVGPARFVVNLLTLPLHAVMTPPGTVMTGNGTHAVHAPADIASPAKPSANSELAEAQRAGNRS